MAQIPSGLPPQNNPAIQTAAKIIQHPSIGTVSTEKVRDGFAGLSETMSPVCMASHKPLTECHTVSKEPIDPTIRILKRTT